MSPGRNVRSRRGVAGPAAAGRLLMYHRAMRPGAPVPTIPTNDGFRAGGHRDYLAALARKYQPEIKRLRSKLRRSRLPSDRAKIQAEIDRLALEWEKARVDAEGAHF